jgi:methionyl aminopeptidase
MKVVSQSRTPQSSLIVLKGADWIQNQRHAGKVVADTLTHLLKRVESGTTKTMLELSREAEQIILDNKCTPTFKNYKGFPEAVCISINKEIVHGIPKDYRLQEGDVVKFDLGATFMAAIADSACTAIFGQPRKEEERKLVSVARLSLYAGIQMVAPGRRIGVIGNAIYRYARDAGFGVITEYGGHGLEENKPHAAPFVPNRAGIEEGVVMQTGMTLAIEPMLTAGVPRTHVGRDGWTITTDDIGAHFEHTIMIHEDHVEIMTLRNDDTIGRELKF